MHSIVEYIKILTVDKTGINNIVLPYNSIKDDLQFTALAELTDCDFSIITLNGNVVVKKHFDQLSFGVKQTIDATNLGSGLYFLVFNERYSSPQILKFVKVN